MIYQIPIDQITGLAKYGLALSCTADSDLAESGLARYAPPVAHASNSATLVVDTKGFGTCLDPQQGRVTE